MDANLSCYLCARFGLSTRKGIVRDDPTLKVLECPDCGLVLLSSVQHIGASHYEESGMHGESLPSIETWLRETERDDLRRFEMLRSMIANRRVLDFGCGAGGFVLRGKALATSISGVEPERRVSDYWGDAITLYPSLQEAEAEYDVITAFHVLEHLARPREVLSELAGRLSDRGQLIIEVPSSEDALLTLYDNVPFQRFTYWSQHLFLFNAETLRRLVNQANLTVLSIRQFQRYPLSNHLYWLSRSAPGGHRHWSFLDSHELTQAYADSLARIGKCDTLIAYLAKK